MPKVICGEFVVATQGVLRQDFKSSGVKIMDEAANGLVIVEGGEGPNHQSFKHEDPLPVGNDYKLKNKQSYKKNEDDISCSTMRPKA